MSSEAEETHALYESSVAMQSRQGITLWRGGSGFNSRELDFKHEDQPGK